MPFESVNPYTGEILEHFNADDAQIISDKINSAQTAFKDWKQLSYWERGEFLYRLADVLDEHNERLARTITREMGKPITESRAEIQKCALTARYYAEHGKNMLANLNLEAKNKKAKVLYQPLGVIFGIFPWNYPMWQVFRFAIPTLMAGNTLVFKHAENSGQCAQAIVKVFELAKFPSGTVHNLFAELQDIETIIGHPHIQAVTLTGSEQAGRSVAALAGKYLKKVVLELGGSDPCIVYPDADIAQAAKIGALSRYQNTGQSCIAAKRFILHEYIKDEFLQAFEKEAAKFSPSDPALESSRLGILARKDLCDRLEEQVEASIQAGAHRLFGAKRLGDTRFEPGALIGIPSDAPAFAEELFGPVASILSFTSDEEALELANKTDFGLGASVWTNDQKKALAMAEAIESGMVYINTMVKSTPELPFGGIKNSGIGRELSSFGIQEFTNTKLIYPVRAWN